jgi:hypothetical protein
MVSMPQWLMKTPEMLASDKYFGLAPFGTAADKAELRQRYITALGRLMSQTYYAQSDAMSGGGLSHPQVEAALEYHFRGDWINAKYPKHSSPGGLFWPQIDSNHVITKVRTGTVGAIVKALGPSNATAAYTGSPFDVGDFLGSLFHPYEPGEPNLDEVLPLSTSWVCVAPPDSTFFEADAVRGPSVVDLVIATPKPIGHSPLEIIMSRIVPETIQSDEPLTWAEALMQIPINDEFHD